MPKVLLLLGQSMFITEVYLPALPLCWRLFLQLYALTKSFILSYLFPIYIPFLLIGRKKFQFLFYSDIPWKLPWKGHPSST